MAYTVIEMEDLVEPFLACDDRLEVNVQKGKTLLLLVPFLCFSILCAYWELLDSLGGGIFVMVLMLSFWIFIFYKLATTFNPMLAIDKTGIAIRGIFYSWDKIDSIFFERDGKRKKASRIRFHLRNGGLITFHIPLFFDHKPPVIAAYIANNFKPVKAKV